MSRGKPDPVPAQAPDKRPIHTIRHRSIKASIWQNSTAKGPVYNVTIVRGFKDGDDWKDSHSFGYDDLPIVAKLLNDCHSFITSLRAKTDGKTSAAPKSSTPASGADRRPQQPA